MAIAWDTIQQQYDDITQELTSATLDQQRRHQLQKQHAHLSTLLTQYNQVELAKKLVQEATQEMSASTDPEMTELFELEVDDLKQKLSREEGRLNELMIPADELDDRSVFLEIRSGAGGQEAALFVADLMRMYSNYALNKGWKVTTENASETDLGGLRELVLYIKGKDVYGHLKRESGVHRVQRVPATETQGRVHTSTVTVAVLPEAEEVDVQVNPADLRIDVFRASGAGGQHVNTTDSAVRITHIPTGVVVSCQDERSQHKNKAKALKILQSRILAARKEEQEALMSKDRKEQVGTGMRAEKVRTYNYPQNRVTDHQVDLTLKKLDRVVEGDLDDIIQALRTQDREVRKEQFFKQFTS